MICDNMKTNKLLIIRELLKETELLAITDLIIRLKIDNPKKDRRGTDKNHLEPLAIKGVIENGFVVKRKINNSFESLKAVRIAPTIEALKQLIVEYPNIIEFQSSVYCQSMITPSFLREIEKLWNLQESYKSETEFKPLIDAYCEQYRKKQAERNESGISYEDIEYIYSDKIHTDKRGPRAPYYMRPDFFTEEDVLEILKLSPTALQKALNGTTIKEKPPQIILSATGSLIPDSMPVDTLNRGYFQEMLLACLILDSGTHHYSATYFNTELSINFTIPGGRKFKKKAGMIKDHTMYQYFKKI